MSVVGPNGSVVAPNGLVVGVKHGSGPWAPCGDWQGLGFAGVALNIEGKRARCGPAIG